MNQYQTISYLCQINGIGKKHAFKTYDHCSLNTNRLFVKFLEIFVIEANFRDVVEMVKRYDKAIGVVSDDILEDSVWNKGLK